jgi:uncharacterized protein YndB with AHSA1/START domain
MSAEVYKFKIRQSINAPAEEVYKAFTQAPVLRRWLCNQAQVDPRPGGKLLAWWDGGSFATGEYEQLKAGKKVAFTWCWMGVQDPGWINVKITAEDEGSRITLTRSAKMKAKEWKKRAESLQADWEEALENLKSLLENGQDLRFVRRPMVGVIGFEELTPEIAQSLNVPIQEGLRLNGIAEGMGAQAAGLQPSDVIVSLGGEPMTRYPDFPRILSKYHAGDTVEVVYYRGKDERKADLTLTGRKMPAVPETPEALADAVQAAYAEADQELAPVLSAASEEQAVARPSASEWNAREVLAHLIMDERGRHSMIMAAIEDQETDFYPYTNRHEAVKAFASNYPSMRDLLEELRRSRGITVSLLRNLPEDVAARPRSYAQIGFLVLENTAHDSEHLGQIRDAIASYRQDSATAKEEPAGEPAGSPVASLDDQIPVGS